MTIDPKSLNHDNLAVYLDGLILMSQIFWGPDEKLCLEMKGKFFQRELFRLATLLDGQGAASVREIAGWLESFPETDNLADHLEADYIRLFVNAAGGIKAPLFQSCYESEDGLLMGRAARMMRQRLQDAGMFSTAVASTPPDHLAVELEYFIFLLDRAHFGNDDSFLARGVEFALREMLPWVRQFSARLDKETKGLFYAAAARVLLSLLDLAEG